MGSNVTLVFLYDDNNNDDEGSSEMLAKLLDWQARNLIQVWEIEEESVPTHLTQRIFDMFE